MNEILYCPAKIAQFNCLDLGIEGGCFLNLFRTLRLILKAHLDLARHLVLGLDRQDTVRVTHMCRQNHVSV